MTIKVKNARNGEHWLIPISGIHSVKELNERSIVEIKTPLDGEEPISYLYEPVTKVWFEYEEQNSWVALIVVETLEDIEYMINTPYNPAKE